jgi:thioredoxin 1
MIPLPKICTSLFLLFALFPAHVLQAESKMDGFSHSLPAKHALEKEPFSQERFETLQAEGAVVLIDVYASWCSTCAKQQLAFETYRKANPDKKFIILEIDFDKQKDLVRQFRAPRQSTLLIHKGKEQFWFSVAETRPDVIAAELDKAINFKPKI